MTLPRLIASGQAGAVDFSDGLHTEIGYLGHQGILEPATVAKGATVETFTGPLRVAASPANFAARQVTIDSLYLIRGSGTAELYHRAQDLWALIQGRPGRIGVGSLYLPVWWDPPKNKQRLESTDRLELALSGEALPATWIAQYGYQVGRSQGICVIDDRLDRSELKGTVFDSPPTGRVFEVTNPGSAPCYAALMLSVELGDFTVDKTVYLRNVHATASARVALTLDYSGTPGVGSAYLSPAAGLLLLPGKNTIRIENLDGALETQTDSSGTDQRWKHSIYGTEFRYLGNDDDLFNEGPPIFSLFRRGPAFAATAASGSVLTSSVDCAARIGVPIGNHAAGAAGLVLEGEVENLFLRSQEFDIGPWTDVGTPIVSADLADANPAPDGTTTADRIDDNDSGAGIEGRKQTITIANDSSRHTVSVHAKKRGPPSYFPEFRMEMTGGTALTSKVRLDLQTGAVAEAVSAGNLAVSVFDCGDFWRIALTMQNNASGNTSGSLTIYPAMTATLGGAEQGGMLGTIDVWGAQWESNPFCTSYIKTEGSKVKRYADYCAVWAPQNRVKYSRQLDQNDTTDKGRWVRSGLTVTADQTMASDGTRTADRLAIAAAADKIYQSYTPDMRPSDPGTGRNGWSLVARVLRGAMADSDSDIVWLALEDQGGNQIASTTVAGSALSTTAARSIPLIVAHSTVGPDDTGLRFVLKGDTGLGDPDIEAVWLTRGLFPGRFVMTEGGIAAPDPSHWEWPTWLTQNGYIEVKALLPRGMASATKSTNNTKLIIGGISGNLTQSSGTLQVISSGGSQNWSFTWAGGTTQSFTNTSWATLDPSYSLVGASGYGTLAVTRDSSPPTPDNTYNDTVTIASSGPSTGLKYYVFGDDGNQDVGLLRLSNEATSSNLLQVVRRSNYTPRVYNFDVGAVWDGQPHIFKVEWLNFKRSGAQQMLLRLSVDGILKGTSNNFASSTETYWSVPERLWLSDGNSYSTLRELKIGSPAWTAGDIPEPYQP